MLDAEQKGERAAAILESEVYAEAVELARQKLKDDWTKARAPQERENLWHQFQAIEAVTVALRILRERGIMELNKKNKEKSGG